VISESATQLQTLINDLLDLARSDAGRLRIEPEPTAVRPMVQKLGRQMRPHFERRGQRLTVSVEKGLPEVEADPSRVDQVLTNLLSNANKYADEDAKIKLTASKNGKTVEFEVSDTGPGLGQEQLEHVFERFWRAKSGERQEVGGTGLGLAISKSLVELHGGTISASSPPGKGASFRFTLPIAKGASSSSGNGSRSRKSSGRARAKAGSS
jgi:two-component system, OmpR family, sensor histidine kinase BaeS